jgi:SOS-response transcriptional repressor LexA
MDDLAASFWEQVNQLIKTQKITQEDLAKSLGIPFGTYRGWNAYKRFPDISSGYKIAQALKTTVEFLVTGKPPEGIPVDVLETARKIVALPEREREEIMLLVKHKLGRYPEPVGKTFFTADPLPAYNVQAHSRSTSSKGKVIDISRYTHNEIPIDGVKFMCWDMTILPFLGKTAAGKPIEVNAYTGEGMPFPRQLLKGKDEDYFIVEIEGTSMTEAGIHTGDYVIIRKAEEPLNGKIMLIRYENSSTLKRIKIKDTQKNGRQVYLYWEDGSGDFKLVDSSEYEIQGEYYRNLGK